MAARHVGILVCIRRRKSKVTVNSITRDFYMGGIMEARNGVKKISKNVDLFHIYVCVVVSAFMRSNVIRSYCDYEVFFNPTGQNELETFISSHTCTKSFCCPGKSNEASLIL